MKCICEKDNFGKKRSGMFTDSFCKWEVLSLGIFILIVAALLQFVSVSVPSSSDILLFSFYVFSFVLSTVGGILLTKAFETDKSFIKKIKPLLKPIILKSHINTSQINKIVQDFNNDPTSPIGIRIEDMIPNLSSVTTDLTNLSEQNLADAMSFFYSDLDQIQETLLRVNNEPNGVSKEEIFAAINKISDISNSFSTSMEKVDAVVKCPFCNTENNISIGVVPPASATPECKKCHNRFHANRQHDGSILIRKPGSRSK